VALAGELAKEVVHAGVYVRSVGRLTPVYMTLIDPFRKLIVYPALLRSVRATWNQTFGTA
jgi:hypothetical protein